MVLASHYFLTSDKVKIHYRQTPVGVQPFRLMLFHGLGDDASIWEKEQRLFWQSGYGSVAVDLRGHGLSGDPTDDHDYSLARLAQDARELITGLKITNAVAVGHSFGGMVVIYLAGKFPRLLTGLVLLNTIDRLPKSVLLPRVLSRFGYAFPAGTSQKHTPYRPFKGVNELNPRRILDDIKSTSLRSYLFCCSHIVGVNEADLLHRIVVPTLVITGDKDRIFPPFIAKKMAARITTADFKIIPQADHIAVLNKPKEIVATTVGFLNSLDRHE
jgi:pimeloyl-ACP methyl ester carboxylesterase